MILGHNTIIRRDRPLAVYIFSNNTKFRAHGTRLFVPSDVVLALMTAV
jgi:hypothetical protein